MLDFQRFSYFCFLMFSGFCSRPGHQRESPTITTVVGDSSFPAITNVFQQLNSLKLLKA